MQFLYWLHLHLRYGLLRFLWLLRFLLNGFFHSLFGSWLYIFLNGFRRFFLFIFRYLFIGVFGFKHEHTCFAVLFSGCLCRLVGNLILIFTSNVLINMAIFVHLRVRLRRLLLRFVLDRLLLNSFFCTLRRFYLLSNFARAL